jgi:enoyl-CoA hydratase
MRTNEEAPMPIHYEPGDDHIVRITIDRPEARNSLDMEHFAQLRRAWERFGDDDEAWVAVVTGVGADFCVGADLKTYVPQITSLQAAMQRDGLTEIDGYRLDDGVKAVLRNIALYKPIVAAVNGTCVAGGMEMLGGCDLRVAADTATFGVLEPKRGLFAGGGTTVRLPRQIPFPAAMELLLCADRLSAQRVYEMGLLNEVCPPEQLLDRAYSYARRITANGPFAVRKTKESVLRGLAVDMKEAYRIESAISSEVFSSDDAVEGPRAFAEKRVPQWTNR